MPVNPVGQNSAPSEPLYQRDTSNDPGEVKVDTETFLKLLVAQLKYQDPLEPQKDTAFVTQMAQMTTLQEMQQMNATLQNSQAYDMVGKEIYAEVLNKATGEIIQHFGVVDSVVIFKGIPYVVVGTEAIRISDVKQVFPPPEYIAPPDDDTTPPDDDTTPPDEDTTLPDDTETPEV